MPKCLKLFSKWIKKRNHRSISICVLQCQSYYISTETPFTKSFWLLHCLTYTSREYVAPDSPAASQTSDLAVSLKSVAMETREGQWVANSKSESHPPAVCRNAGILAWLQVVFYTSGRDKQHCWGVTVKGLKWCKMYRNWVSTVNITNTKVFKKYCLKNLASVKLKPSCWNVHIGPLPWITN